MMLNNKVIVKKRQTPCIKTNSAESMIGGKELEQIRQEVYEEEINLRELIEVLLRGKKIIAGITILAVLVAGIFSFFIIAPKYEATTTLMVSAITPNNLNVEEENAFKALLDSLSSYPRLTMETYRAQVKNPHILKQVIDELKLDPEKYTIRSLSESIEVEAVRDTNLIQIKVRNTDPALAAQIANSLTQKFVDFISDKTKEQIEKSAWFLKERLDEEKQNLERATQELKAFLAQPRGVNELQQEINSKIDQLTQFKTQLVNLEVDEQETRASLAKARAELENQPRTLITTKSITDDPLMQGIAQEKTNLNITDLSNLKMESEQINPVYIDLQQSITSYNIKLSRITAQKRAIQQKITETQKQLETLQAELAEKQITYEQLQRKLSMAKDNYNIFLQKYQESRITQSAKIGETNIMIVSPAIIPENPVSPNKKLNMAIAGVLGIMVGVFTVFFIEFWKNTDIEAKTTRTV